MPLIDELFTKRAVVVNLAVENHARAGLLVPHRLVPAREVDDAEPAHRKPKTILGPDTIIIGPAMHDRSIHLSQYLDTLLTRKRTRDTNNSTHQKLTLCSGTGHQRKRNLVRLSQLHADAALGFPASQYFRLARLSHVVKQNHRPGRQSVAENRKQSITTAVGQIRRAVANHEIKLRRHFRQR